MLGTIGTEVTTVPVVVRLYDVVESESLEVTGIGTEVTIVPDVVRLKDVDSGKSVEPVALAEASLETTLAREDEALAMMLDEATDKADEIPVSVAVAAMLDSSDDSEDEMADKTLET